MGTNESKKKGFIGNKLGATGENIAAEFLKRKGFTIIGRNYWKKWGEIDLIAKQDSKLHFVEVKTVSCENIEAVSHETEGYRPEDNVHPKKLERLGRTIQSYLLENGVEDQEWQFDVVAVFYEEKGRRAKVRRIDDVVL